MSGLLMPSHHRDCKFTGLQSCACRPGGVVAQLEARLAEVRKELESAKRIIKQELRGSQEWRDALEVERAKVERLRGALTRAVGYVDGWVRRSDDRDYIASAFSGDCYALLRETEPGGKANP